LELHHDRHFSTAGRSLRQSAAAIVGSGQHGRSSLGVDSTMTATRIGINGFGRIGRNYLRSVIDAPDLEVVAVNDVFDSASMARLLRYDSTFGPFDHDVVDLGDAISVDGRKIAVSAERDPVELDWRQHGVEVVIESTGKFRTRDTAAAHLTAGASTVLKSALVART
jgi:glyceraldehyde 3-phosphate dehydrogenase